MSMTSNKGPRILIASIDARTSALEKGLARADQAIARHSRSMEARTSQARRRIEAETATMATRANQNLARIGATPIKINLAGLHGALDTAKGALAGMVAGAFGGVSLQAIQATVGELAKVKDVAERTGASSRFIQELTFAVKQSGGEAADAASGLQKFAVNVSKAAQGGGDLAKILDANGVAIRNAAGELRPLEELLGEVANLVKNAENEQDALNIATLAFGRNAGPALVVALKDGHKGLVDFARDANKTGAVIEDRLIDRAATLDDEFTKLGDRLSGIGKRIAIEFGGPVVEAGMTALLGYLNEVRKTIEDIKSANIADLLVRPEIRNFIAGSAPQFGPRSPDDERAELERQQANIKARVATAEARIAAATAAGRGAAGSEAQLGKLKTDLAEIERRIAAINANPLAIDYQPSRAGYTAGGDRPGSDRPTVMPSEDGGGSSDQSAVFRMIAKFESFISRAKWDVNHYRAGYGSDTTTAADGTVSRVTASTITTVADATRDLNRRIGEFQNGIRGQIGADRFNAMGDEQQAALTSIAYNYGELPNRIVNAIVSGGTTADIANAIRRLGGDNGGINRNRRDDEAETFAGGASYAQRTADKAIESDRDRTRDGARRVEDINAETDALGRQAQASATLAASLEQFDAQAERSRIVREELRKLADAEIEATPERIAAINALADAQVAAAQRRAEAEKKADKARQQRDAHEKASQELYQLGLETTKGVAADLRAGASAAEVFSNALNRIASKLMDMAIEALWAKAFGGVGGASGGIFGSLATMFGFADGGYTGPGGVHEPAGVVHRGEVVWSQADIARAGGVGTVEAMRRGKRGYAQGGVVGLLPAILPTLAPPALPSASAALGGGSVSQAITIAPAITVNTSGGTPEQNDDMAKRIGAEVENSIRSIVDSRILTSLRPGGVLDTAARRR